MSFKRMVAGSLCAAVLSGTVFAQEPARQLGTPATAQVGQAGQAGQAGANVQLQSAHQPITPQQIATCLAIGNQEEVVLSKYAQDKAKSEKVSKFAKMMVEEHQDILKQLAKWAPEAGQEGFLTSNSNSGNTSNSQSGGTSGVRPGTVDSADNAGNNRQGNANQGNNGSNDPNLNPQRSGANQTAGTAGGSSNASSLTDVVQLHRELAQQCIADSKKKLDKEEGEKFDKCFIGMQIAKHAAMHSQLSVLQRHTTGELQQLISTGLEATDKHLKEAESIMKDLDHDSDSHSKSEKRDSERNK